MEFAPRIRTAFEIAGLVLLGVSAAQIVWKLGVGHVHDIQPLYFAAAGLALLAPELAARFVEWRQRRRALAEAEEQSWREQHRAEAAAEAARRAEAMRRAEILSDLAQPVPDPLASCAHAELLHTSRSLSDFLERHGEAKRVEAGRPPAVDTGRGRVLMEFRERVADHGAIEVAGGELRFLGAHQPIHIPASEIVAVYLEFERVILALHAHDAPLLLHCDEPFAAPLVAAAVARLQARTPAGPPPRLQ